jgi:hypothetical protein
MAAITPNTDKEQVREQMKTALTAFSSQAFVSNWMRRAAAEAECVNMVSTGFTVSADDMRRIDVLAGHQPRIVDRDSIEWAPVWS